MKAQRLVDLYNKIHQFEEWTFATMGLDDMPVTVSAGDMTEGVEYLLCSLRIHIKLKVIVAQDAVDIAKEKLSTLERYQDEIESYAEEDQNGGK